MQDCSATEEVLQRRLSAWLQEMSRDDVVAQIESESFRSICGDEATVWRDGRIVLGPLLGGARSEDFGKPLVINEALRFMGFSLNPANMTRRILWP